MENEKVNIIFRILLTFSALSLFIALYFINRKIAILHCVPNYWSYLLYTALPFVFSFVCTRVSKKLGSANLGKVEFVETSNNDFLSNYLAFFFVALSLDNWAAFIFCFGLTALFVIYSRVSYFNPIFLIYGYNFYYVHLENKSKIMLITKQKIKSPLDVHENKQYRRINDYTFMG